MAHDARCDFAAALAQLEPLAEQGSDNTMSSLGFLHADCARRWTAP